MAILKKYNLALVAIFSFGTLAFGQDPMTTDQPQGNQPNKDNIVNATWQPSLVNDGVIDHIEHINRAIEWTNPRENDVAWAQRVWRQIDVRQKQNQAFIYKGDDRTGGGAFIEILIDLIKKGKIMAYNPIDDRFATPLTKESFENAIGGGYDTVEVPDVITGEITRKITKKELNIDLITKYQVKEDWIFDRNLGKLVVKIIGIAPLIDRYDEATQQFKYSTPMFWIYYPEARKELVNYEVYNPVNMVNRMNWTDFLDRRYFSSYIIKTSINNPFGHRLSEDINGLYEGQEILNDLINRESDMWER